MIDPVARRYASALREEAREAKALDAVDEAVASLHTLLKDAPELGRVFRSPIVPTEKKISIAEQLLSDRTHPLVMRLVRLLLSKGREALIPDVIAGYAMARDEEEGIIDATVRTAKALTPDELASLEEALERTSGKRVRISHTVQPDLIGGLVVRLGDTVYDGSVRHHLETLHRQLAARAQVSLN
jgi:F-type H+-transporting ATPase subunit delta